MTMKNSGTYSLVQARERGGSGQSGSSARGNGAAASAPMGAAAPAFNGGTPSGSSGELGGVPSARTAGGPSWEKTWTQDFPAAPRPAEDVARLEGSAAAPSERPGSESSERLSLGRALRGLREFSLGKPGVSRFTMVGVGLIQPLPAGQGSAPASPPGAGEAKPKRQRPQAARGPVMLPPRPVKGDPSRVLAQSSRPLAAAAPPHTVPDATLGDEARRLAHTFAAPSLSPIPKAKPGSEASQQSQVVIAPSFAAAPSAKASDESRRAQGARTPLLRAFDPAEVGAAARSTAKTVAIPPFHGATAAGGAAAPLVPVERGEPTLSSLSLSQRLLRNLRQASRVEKLSAIVVVAAVVLGSGTLLARSSGKGPVRRKVSTAASATPPPPRAEPHAVAEAPKNPPGRALAPTIPPAPETAATEPFTPRATGSEVGPSELVEAKSIDVELVEAKLVEAKLVEAKLVPSEPSPRHPAKASDGSASSGVTLARQAVDALLAGDRPKALRIYTELSRTAPERAVYREAVRLLAPAAADTPQ